MHDVALWIFGFDASTQTIYLSKSTADAPTCLDLEVRVCRHLHGDLYCNGCWNQEFQVVGPADECFKLSVERVAPLGLEDLRAESAGTASRRSDEARWLSLSMLIFLRCLSSSCAKNSMRRKGKCESQWKTLPLQTL